MKEVTGITNRQEYFDGESCRLHIWFLKFKNWILSLFNETLLVAGGIEVIEIYSEYLGMMLNHLKQHAIINSWKIEAGLLG